MLQTNFIYYRKLAIWQVDDNEPTIHVRTPSNVLFLWWKKNLPHLLQIYEVKSNDIVCARKVFTYVSSDRSPRYIWGRCEWRPCSHRYRRELGNIPGYTCAPTQTLWDQVCTTCNIATHQPTISQLFHIFPAWNRSKLLPPVYLVQYLPYLCFM